MIYLLYGTDERRAREKLHQLVQSLSAKRPDASYFHITEETEYSLEELIGAQGLFEHKYIVAFDHMLTSAEAKKEFIAHLKAFKESPHIFIFLEGALDAKTATAFKKHAEKVQECGGESKEKESFNIFSLTDALGRRDHKKLWALYQKAVARRVPPEELHGILFWQVKSMLLAATAAGPAEAGLSPFVFKKSKGFLKHFTREELVGMSGRLVRMSHDAHRGLVDFSTALERFMLKL